MTRNARLSACAWDPSVAARGREQDGPWAFARDFGQDGSGGDEEAPEPPVELVALLSADVAAMRANEALARFEGRLMAQLAHKRFRARQRGQPELLAILAVARRGTFADAAAGARKVGAAAKTRVAQERARQWRRLVIAGLV